MWQFRIESIIAFVFVVNRGGFHLPSLRPVSIAYGQNISARSGSTPPSFSSFDDMMSPRSVADSNVSLQSELGELDSPQSAKGKQKETKTCDQGQVTDSINVREFATATSNSISWLCSLLYFWSCYSSCSCCVVFVVPNIIFQILGILFHLLYIVMFTLKIIKNHNRFLLKYYL